MLKTIIVLLLPLFSITQKTEAAPIFFSFGEEKVLKVADFPQGSYQSNDGQHVDAGVRYKQVSIFFIPIWNYEEKWCGYISDKMYVDLPRSQLEEMAAESNVKLPGSMQMPFWDKFGGKLLAIALIAGYVLYKQNRRKSLVYKPATQPAATTPPPPASDTPVAP